MAIPAQQARFNDVGALLQQLLGGGQNPGFASTRTTAAPMTSVGTPAIGGLQRVGRRGRDTQFQGAETRAGRAGGNRTAAPGVSRAKRRGTPPGMTGSGGGSAQPARAGQPITHNDPHDFAAGASAQNQAGGMAQGIASGRQPMPMTQPQSVTPGSLLGRPGQQRRSPLPQNRLV